MNAARPDTYTDADYEAVLLMLEDRLSDERFDELNQRAARDSEFARLFLLVSEQRWALTESLSRSSCFREFSAATARASKPSLTGTARPSRMRIDWTAVTVFAAAIIALAAVGVSVWSGSGTDEPATPIAVASVVAMEGSGSSATGDLLIEGADVTAGTLRVDKGLVELMTTSGVHLALRGPGEYDLASGMHARIRSGSLAARVPPRASGYTVRARGVKVVDLGTEFSVGLQIDGRVRVDVHAGSVNATEFDVSGKPVNTQLITASQARVYNGDGSAAPTAVAAVMQPVFIREPMGVGDPGIAVGKRPDDVIVIDPGAIQPYSDQDALGGMSSKVSMSEGGTTVTLSGNAWKALALDYRVGPDTAIEFEYRVANAGELIGIGLDDDNTHETFGRLFVLAGTDNLPKFFDYRHKAAPAAEWRRVLIRVGSKDEFHAKHLVLFADDDERGAAEASFRNIRIYDSPEMERVVTPTEPTDPEINPQAQAPKQEGAIR